MVIVRIFHFDYFYRIFSSHLGRKGYLIRYFLNLKHWEHLTDPNLCPLSLKTPAIGSYTSIIGLV